MVRVLAPNLFCATIVAIAAAATHARADAPPDKPVPPATVKLMQEQVAYVLGKAPATRTAAEVNAAAEAALLVYACDSRDETLDVLVSQLSTLWKESKDQRPKATRLGVLASQFRVTTITEAGELARTHASSNTFFAFCYARRLWESGQGTQAAKVIGELPATAPFSADECGGLRDLVALLHARSSRPEDECALDTWRVLSRSNWTDYNFVLDLVVNRSFGNLASVLDEEHAPKFRSARIHAAASLLADAPLLRDRFLGRTCVRSLRRDAESLYQSRALLEQEYKQSLAEIDNSAGDLATVERAAERWVGLPDSEISAAMAKKLIEGRQMEVISHLPPQPASPEKR